MKLTNSLLLASAVVIAFACANKTQFGSEFDSQKAISINDALTNFKTIGAKEAIVTGEISKVCQTEGCWFNYKTKDGDQFVEFGHKFNIPKDAAGKQIHAKGYFYYDTTSVEDLKELAADDGKPKEEIDAIAEPKVRTVFRAEGVSFASK